MGNNRNSLNDSCRFCVVWNTMKTAKRSLLNHIGLGKTIVVWDTNVLVASLTINTVKSALLLTFVMICTGFLRFSEISIK